MKASNPVLMNCKEGADYRENFVRIWQASPTVQAVADKLGCTTVQASAVAAWLRRHRVAVKNMPRLRGGNDIDFSALGALIDVAPANGTQTETAPANGTQTETAPAKPAPAKPAPAKPAQTAPAKPALAKHK